MSPYLRKKLNPLKITLTGFKDVPAKTDPRYTPIYSIFNFVDGASFKTKQVPQNPTCKFNHEHVFLIGLIDAIKLKELLATKMVRVYLHDSEEYCEEERDFGKGLAQFSFRDLLRPNCKELKLRSDVFPTKRISEDNTQNLDLNSTARKKELALDKLNPYLMMATYCVLKANLAHPIALFDEATELAKYGGIESVEGRESLQSAEQREIIEKMSRSG